ncbi:DUF3991 and TOPRIM domain-containing protein [Parabacteroides sp. PF5-9]|uniref:DUF3991 and TOPRIM domain-containing protein n=1 Tax=Parabacteroides sp. PF5-9 TaxID=1742404 RepID=UPI0024738CE4|nr:DUF3991 and TOPRIM domain-containing protein [Parabacteroides sp. PF5-9]MDH6358970.1 hypothetical protein [Parabacteroides sp. PF5-9]
MSDYIFIPKTISGVEVTPEVRERIKNGEAVFMQGLLNKSTNEIYNSYVYWNKEKNKLAFSRQNPFEVKANPFDEFKQKVSVHQVAQSIGYEVDKKSTSLRLMLSDPSGDKILLSRTGANIQLYRNLKNDTDRGTVIDFVSNRLDRFNVPHNTKMEGVIKVLSSFVGKDFTIDSPTFKSQTKPFNIDSYAVKDSNVAALHYLTQARNITSETVNRFLPFIKLVGVGDQKFKNVGFPFIVPGNDEIRGFELRNYGKENGFKSFSTGGDKVNAVWLANLAGSKVETRDVYFFESSIDALSFYDLYNTRQNFNNAAFVSTGGSISINQMLNVFKEYPDAKIHACFDNDRAGQLMDISLSVASQNKHLSKVLTKDGVIFDIDGKNFLLKNDEISMKNFEAKAGFKSDIEVHKASIGKDFNEVLQKKNDMNPVVKPRFL